MISSESENSLSVSASTGRTSGRLQTFRGLRKLLALLGQALAQVFDCLEFGTCCPNVDAEVKDQAHA